MANESKMERRVRMRMPVRLSVEVGPDVVEYMKRNRYTVGRVDVLEEGGREVARDHLWVPVEWKKPGAKPSVVYHEGGE